MEKSGFLLRLGDSVYDVTEFCDRHPGGSILRDACRSGLDAAKLFESHHIRPP